MADRLEAGVAHKGLVGEGEEAGAEVEVRDLQHTGSCQLSHTSKLNLLDILIWHSPCQMQLHIGWLCYWQSSSSETKSTVSTSLIFVLLSSRRFSNLITSSPQRRVPRRAVKRGLPRWTLKRRLPRGIKRGRVHQGQGWGNAARAG